MPRSANYKKIFICIVSPLLSSIIVFQNLFSVQYDISDSCLCTVKFLDIICIQKLNFFKYSQHIEMNVQMEFPKPNRHVQLSSWKIIPNVSFISYISYSFFFDFVYNLFIHFSSLDCKSWRRRPLWGWWWFLC